jgi:gamma-glutamylcyclotransferase (GGCT)/AIG2-like uncharacterized protein YtfP
MLGEANHAPHFTGRNRGEKRRDRGSPAQPAASGARPNQRISVMPLVFSYGTLQQQEVQQATFGRRLLGSADELAEYQQVLIKIEDPGVVAVSGKTHHPIVKFTGIAADRVAGTVFEISDFELGMADDYEVDAYTRVRVRLVSGKDAWVYVDARFADRKQP